MLFVKNWKSLVEYDLPKCTKYHLKPSPKGIVHPKIKHYDIIYLPCCSKTCMTFFGGIQKKMFGGTFPNIIGAH